MDGPLTIDGLDLSAPAPGRCLPAGAFTSAAVFEAELGRIFGHSWVHLADVAELGAAGDFVAATIGTVPVVVLRGHDGELRGFRNAGRPPGPPLAGGRGNAARRPPAPS